MAKAQKIVKEKKHGYSPMERSLLAAMKSAGKKKLTTTDLVGKVYSEGEAPIAARQSVMSVMNILIRKVEENEEPFRINRTNGSGPVPNEFWMEGR